MISKKVFLMGLFTMMLLGSLVVSGCFPPQPEHKELTVSHIYEPNMVQPIRPLTSPPPGQHNFVKGATTRVSAHEQDSQGYLFKEWRITTLGDDYTHSYTTTERQVDLVMDTDMRANARFGCADSSVCHAGYECVDGFCVESSGNMSLMDQFISVIESYGHTVSSTNYYQDDFWVVTSDNYNANYASIYPEFVSRSHLIDMIVSDYYHNTSSNTLLYHDADSLSNSVAYMRYIRARSDNLYEYLNIAFWVTPDDKFVYFGIGGIVDYYITPEALPYLDPSLVLELEGLTPGDPLFISDFFAVLHGQGSGGGGSPGEPIPAVFGAMFE